MDTRVALEQAKGVLSQRLGLRLDEAFTRPRFQAGSGLGSGRKPAPAKWEWGAADLDRLAMIVTGVDPTNADVVPAGVLDEMERAIAVSLLTDRHPTVPVKGLIAKFGMA